MFSTFNLMLKKNITNISIATFAISSYSFLVYNLLEDSYKKNLINDKTIKDALLMVK